MASMNTTSNSFDEEQPISRTYQYRKVMKPMLERKRRARINRCLDELKELMSSALAAEGENLTKLEKADVLELTVRHLHKLRDRQTLTLNQAAPASSYADKFRAGFAHCATEVSCYLSNATGLDVAVGSRLLSHLSHCIRQIDVTSTNPMISAAPTVPFFPAHTKPTLGGMTLPAMGPSTYTPPSSPTLLESHQPAAISTSRQSPSHYPTYTTSNKFSSFSPSTPMLSPVSSPALSEADSLPCDYSKDSLMKSSISPNAMDNGRVWRPW